MKASAIQLGKALNDPTKGVTALSRVGVTFTQQQKDQIKALQESGDTMGAQKVILKELQKEFGGSAKAAGDTFAGKVKHLRDVWDGFVESLVRKVIPILDRVVTWISSKLPPAIQAFQNRMQAAQPAIDNLGSAFKGLGSVLPSVIGFIKTFGPAIAAGVVAFVAINKAITTYKAIITAVKAAQIALNIAMTANPVGLIVAAIAALVGAFVLAYQHSEKFRAVVDTAFNGIKTAIATAMPVIKTVVSAAFGFIRTYITNVMNIIRGVIKVVTSVIKGDWKGAWNGIKQIVSGVLGNVKSLISAGMNAARGLMSAAWNAVKSITSSAWNGIKGAVSRGVGEVVSFVRGLPGKAKSALGNLAGLLVGAGGDLIRGLLQGINAMAGQVVQRVKNLASDAVSGFKSMLGIHSPSRVFRELGKFTMQGLRDGMDDGAKGVLKVTEKVTKEIKKAFADESKAEKKRIAERMKRQKKSSAAIARAQSRIARRSGAATSKAIRSLANENKALLNNAKKREAVNAKLEAAQKNLDALKKQSAEYKHNVVDSVLAYGNITSLDSAFTSTAMAQQLQDRINKTKQYASLLNSLAKQGLNKTMYDQLVQAGVEGGLATAQAIASGGPAAIKQFNSLQSQLSTAANSLGTTASNNMYAAGIQAAQGLVNGLKSQSKALEKEAARLANKLAAAIKKALKIKSPSRVFKEIGNYTVQGLEVGLKNTRGVETAMVNISDAMKSSYNPELRSVLLETGGTQSTKSAGNTYNINITAPANVDKVAMGREVASAIDAYEKAGGRRAA